MNVSLHTMQLSWHTPAKSDNKPRPVFTPKLPNQTLDEPKVLGSRRKRRVGGRSVLEDLGSQLSLAAPELLIADAPLRSLGCFNLALGERQAAFREYRRSANCRSFASREASASHGPP